MRMLRKEESELERDIRVLCCGKRFRYSKKETVVEREKQHRVFEKRYPCIILHITPYKERKRKKRYP